MADAFSQLMENPMAILDVSYDEVSRMPPEQIRTFQNYWVAKRYAEFRPNIPYLDKLAKEQGVEKVQDIDDIVPLLYAHTVYKSYPLSYIDRSQFDRLTKWLNRLTTIDLSHIDATGIESIDDWIDLLDKETPLEIMHTSGTTGKLSFLPRTRLCTRQNVSLLSNIRRDWYGTNSMPDLIKTPRPFIDLVHRYGGASRPRFAAASAEMFAGGDHNALFLYNSRLSADLMSLSGRIRAAEARGEQGALAIPPALLRRREELLEMEKNQRQVLDEFINKARVRFGGQDVLFNAFFNASYGLFYDWAVKGLKEGYKNIFGPNTLVVGVGRGNKDMDTRVYPEESDQIIKEFVGCDISTLAPIYAMIENMNFGVLCEEGKFHLPPTQVNYLLDPKTGKLLPRRDNTTGRLATFDLLTETYWMGLVTGDRVTMGGWEQTCKCGRTGCHVDMDIRRFSQMEGGDDKVTCGGAPEAHDKAAAFLASL